MCGIAGFISSPSSTFDRSTLASMMKAIEHRGPDGHGIFVDEVSRVFLGHQRLAIVDISPTGAQPMYSASGQTAIVLNGEIYNFKELKVELEKSGIHFRGHSDTEVLVNAIELWGIDHALQRIEGMFAFASFDLKNRQLFLARDRFGEKPLVFGRIAGGLAFASELKALHPLGLSRLSIEQKARQLFFKYGHIPAPWTIYRDIFKLHAGHRIQISVDHLNEFDVASSRPYWEYRNILNDKHKNLSGDLNQSIDRFEKIFLDIISQEMISDVPLGALLSGGTDSSLVVGAMQKVSASKVKTYSIGFREGGFDEAPFAKQVAHHLKTEHHELYVTANDALQIIPKISSIYDEPFSPPSSIPLILLSHFARKEVTVALSGDGGDEIFGGYDHYSWIPKLDRRTKFLPNFLRAAIKSRGGPFIRAKRYLGAKGAHQIYLNFRNFEAGAKSILKSKTEVITGFDQWNGIDSTSIEERLMFLDVIQYLPDDILAKVDRASMAASLETRAPFLHHRLAEFANTLSLNHKITSTTGKFILKRTLERYLPRNLVERPKAGFAVPIAFWLRHELRNWAQDLITELRRIEPDVFDWLEVEKRWREFLSGCDYWSIHLWMLTIYASWRVDHYRLAKII